MTAGYLSLPSIFRTSALRPRCYLKDGKATACITYGKSRDESLEDFAEIISLYVLPEYWSQKQGYELMQFSM